MNPNALMDLLRKKKESMKKVEKTTKLKPGANRVRILPGWRSIDPATGKAIPGADPTFSHDFGQHFVKDAADQLQAVYLCTHATYEKTCSVCTALATAARTVTDDDTLKVLEQAKANRSILVNALMLDSPEPNTPVILDLKFGLFSKLINILEECEGSPLDPEAGQIIIMTREGTGKLTKYDAQVSLKTYKVPTATLTKLHNLDEYVKQESEEQQRKAVSAVNAVAGFLGSAPTAASDRPMTSPSALTGPKAGGDEFDDIPDFDAAEAPKPATATEASALDSELDDLLGDLS